MTRMVWRYLSVTEYDQQSQLSSECLTYKEERPKGYIDPFVKVEDEFYLESHDVPQLWRTRTSFTEHGTQLTGTMFTEADGKNAINATIVSRSLDHETRYTFMYSHHVNSAVSYHDDMIWKLYEGSCKTVPSFRQGHV